jgi:hypothetical protein
MKTLLSITFAAIGTLAASLFAPVAQAEMITPQGRNICLDMKDRGTGNGTQVQLWACSGGTHQRFGRMQNGQLRNAFKCLTAASNASGALVQLFDCGSRSGQTWTAYSDGTLRNDFGRCMDVRTSNFSNGAVIQSYACNGTAAQKFSIYPSEQCFGAIGNGCLGAGGGAGNIVTPPATDLGNGFRRQWVSVGSIMHDNCCRVTPEGQHCQGVSAAQEGWPDTAACVREWRKAFYNSRDGRRWAATFGPYGSHLDTDSLNRVTGRTGVLHNWQGQAVGRYNGVETSSSIVLRAPRGTALDTGDEQYCASGRGRYVAPSGLTSSYIVCE